MGPIAAAILLVTILAILVTAFSKNKGVENVSLGMAISLIGALVCGQVIGDAAPMIAFMGISVLIIHRWHHPIATAIMMLYGARCAWVFVDHVAVLPGFWFWDINNLMVLAQAGLAMYGGTMNGGLRIRNLRDDTNGAVHRLYLAADLSDWLHLRNR